MTSALPERCGVQAATLPWFGPQVVFSSTDRAGGTPLALRAPRVLVVEDDYFVSTEIEDTLVHGGFDVIGVTATGEEAIEVAERGQPDLVLMDIRLAGLLDGIDTAVVIHARFGIRSLFVTAHSDPVTRERAKQASPLGWTTKPFTTHQLTSAVEAALKVLADGR